MDGEVMENKQCEKCEAIDLICKELTKRIDDLVKILKEILPKEKK